MAVDVDAARVRSRTSQLRRAGSPVVPLLVSLHGVDREATARAVSDVLSTVSLVEGVSWQVYPTVAGACAWFVNTSQWKLLVEPLVAGLEVRGFSGSVTSPDRLLLDDFIRAQPPRPTLFSGFRLEVPVTDLPVNEYGVPAFRWGVAREQTGELLAATARWVPLEDGATEVTGAGPTLPAAPEDAADLLDLCLPYADQTLVLHSVSLGSGRYRAVCVQPWGQVARVRVEPGMSDVELAASLIPTISATAPGLEIAVIDFAGPLFPSWSSLSNGGLWVLNRGLWASLVDDVHGIQLLTSEHLERATDLSGWKVTRVADDRWLVCAPDLRDWYEMPDQIAWAQGQFPSPDVVAQARRDFGAMIASEEELQQRFR